MTQVGAEDPQAFFDFLWLRNGYELIRIMPDGSIAATVAFLFTDAIITGIGLTGYEDRWCFKKVPFRLHAKAALLAWSGDDHTEPQGWHRHPGSGRRRDEDGNETINY